MNLKLYTNILILFLSATFINNSAVAVCDIPPLVSEQCFSLANNIYESECTYPIIQLCICYALVKYIILDNALSYLLRNHSQYTFLCNFLYYLGARVSAQKLRQACMDKNTDLAMRYLQYGANPRKANYNGMYYARSHAFFGFRHYTNVLQLACDNGDLKLVQALVHAGADVNDMDWDYAHRPLDFAKTDEIINFLLTSGALQIYLKKNKNERHYWCEKYIDAISLGKILKKLKKDMISYEDMQAVVNCICNEDIDYKTTNLYNNKEKRSAYRWVRDLYEALYRCVQDNKKRNDLLLQLYAHKKCYRRFDQISVQAAIIHDDTGFLEQLEIDVLLNKEWCDWNYFLGLADKFKSDKVVVYFYQNHEKWNINLNGLWCRAAQNLAFCLKHLLSNASEPLQELQRKNEQKQTVFYVGITKKTITDLEDFPCFAENKIEFLNQELHAAVDIEKSGRIEDFLKFCSEHVKISLCKDVDEKSPVERIQERYQTECDARSNKVQMCAQICRAFESYEQQK